MWLINGAMTQTSTNNQQPTLLMAGQLFLPLFASCCCCLCQLLSVPAVFQLLLSLPAAFQLLSVAAASCRHDG